MDDDMVFVSRKFLRSWVMDLLSEIEEDAGFGADEPDNAVIVWHLAHRGGGRWRGWCLYPHTAEDVIAVIGWLGEWVDWPTRNWIPASDMAATSLPPTAPFV